MIIVIFFFLITVIIEITWCLYAPRKIPIYQRQLIIFLSNVILTLTYFSIQSVTNDNIYTLLFISIFMIFIGLNICKIPYIFTRYLNGVSWQHGIAKRNNPNKPLIIVADSHWNSTLIELKEIQNNNPKADWLFIGDIFDIWINTPNNRLEMEDTFLKWVYHTRNMGNWIGFWLGNREFFLDNLIDKFDFIGEGIGGQLINENLHWEHGDFINTKDWLYRLFFLTFRSSTVWLASQLMPTSIIHKIAIYLKIKINNTNSKYKTHFPEIDFIKTVKQYKHHTFITGHFHIHKIYRNSHTLPWAKNGNFIIWFNEKINLYNKYNTDSKSTSPMNLDIRQHKE